MSNAIAATSQTPAVETVTVNAKKPAAKKGFSFGDLIDAINPLHHIPVVGTIYRAITGDKIRPEARIIGGAVFGGPIGMGLAAADTILESETGKDAGQHVTTLFTGDKSKTAVAATTTDLAADPAKTAALAAETAEAAKIAAVEPSLEHAAEIKGKTQAFIPMPADPVKVAQLPELTEDQMTALARTFGSGVLLENRETHRAKKTEDTKAQPAAAKPAAAYSERQVAYDEALRRMTEGLMKYQSGLGGKGGLALDGGVY